MAATTTKKTMIFGKVDVTLPNHPRMLRIPATFRAAALGVWTAALLYSRWAELDGYCPLEAIHAIATDQIVEWLVTVGLLSRDEDNGVHGVRVLRYEVHNETRKEIESARAGARQRMRRHRRDSKNNSNTLSGVSQASSVTANKRRTNAFVPDSDSDSDLSFNQDQTREAPAVRVLPEKPIVALSTLGVRDRETAEGVTMAAGPFDIEATWLLFLTSGKPRTPGEWQNWCVKAASFAKRDRDRERDRQAALQRPGAPWTRPEASVVRYPEFKNDDALESNVGPPANLMDAFVGGK